MVAAKRKSGQSVQVGEAGDILEVMPLGAGSEVGRSCIIVKFKGKTVMFDCGIHPAYEGIAALPFFDEIDPASVDLALITHFHLDHCAAVPYFLEKTNFRGRVFMTHPTKAIYKMLLTDYVKQSKKDEMLYDEKDLLKSMDKIEQINYHQEMEISGIKFRCYNAGHVLGAAMFMIEIAGVKVLYTGDFSRHEDRHLCGAETPPMTPDVLIVESTYGVTIHEPRKERETRFCNYVHETVARGGRCLLPVFALGRAQELLLILDEYWTAHPELHNVPIYYLSSLAKKCMDVYQTYINMMNDRIRARFEISNPFKFQYVQNLKSLEAFDDIGPCVVMASPGMLQSGQSRMLFEMWCSDPKNGCVLPGYCVEGTLAKHIMSEPSEITTSDGRTVPLRLSVQSVSFSAHSDFQQTSEFIESVQPPNVVLVHGDVNEMGRLRQALQQKYSDKKVHVFTPKNCQRLHLTFTADNIAKVVGSLATKPPLPGTVMSGVVVRKDLSQHVMNEQEMQQYTQLSCSTVYQRLAVPCTTPWFTLRAAISKTYDTIDPLFREDKPAVKVLETVWVQQADAEHVILEWTSNPVNDMIADSLLHLILQAETQPALVQEINKFKDDADIDALRSMRWLLAKQFGDVRLDEDKKTLFICVDKHTAVVNDESKAIECDDEALKTAVLAALRRIQTILYPLPEAACG